jgi:putative transposase
MELAAEREAVNALRERYTELSVRRACELVGMNRGSYRYQHKRNQANEELTGKLKDLAMERPRFGYRRLAILLRRESDEAVNIKRVHRLYRAAGLRLRPIKRKKLRREAVPLVRLTKANQEWAMDFVHDAATNGQNLRFFTLVDQYTRECLQLAVDTSMPSQRVIRELTEVIAKRGKPQRIRMDNGSEFTSRTFLAWCIGQKIEMVHIRPGKPIENGHCESFNGRLREEFLNVHEFRHLWQARQLAEDWMTDYNNQRPHSSLDYRTPREFAALLTSPLISATGQACPAAT